MKNEGVILIIKPKKLNLGDRVAIIAPSSPSTDEDVEKGEKMIRAMDLTVMYPTCYYETWHFQP